MKKTGIVLTVLLICLSIFCLPAAALNTEGVYDTYIYGNDKDYGDGEPIGIPSVFAKEKVYDGYDLGVGAMVDLKTPTSDDSHFYISDSGNNRVLVFDHDFSLVYEIKNFQLSGVADGFSSPMGLYSDGKNLLICDSGNQRLLLFSTDDFSPVRAIEKPEIDLLEDETGDYIFTPTGAVMDKAGRFYVIASGVNQGIIRLDKEGEFITFIGAPDVVPDFATLVWRKFATKEQKKRLQQFVPTEYDSLMIDGDGFIYAASKTSESEAFVKLNSSGDNILPSVPYFGDASQSDSDNSLKPYFVDMALDENGVSFLLDSRQGKIYAYNSSCELLYAFGGNSLQQGNFQSASSIEYCNGKLYVTDQNKNTVTVFGMTEFGKLVHSANKYYNENDNENAYKAYSEILNYCPEYLPATTAISNIDNRNGKTTEALKKLKQIHDYENYSKIFETKRNNIIRTYGLWIILIAAAAAAAVLLVRNRLKKIGAVREADSSGMTAKLKYSKYVMYHPFDGFWDIKHEGRGNAAATVLLVIFTVIYGIRAQFSGYITTKTISSEVDVIYKCFTILLPLAFWIISNWCFTTLMDGKGTLKDIYITTCYALRPYIVFSIPLFVLSHLLVADEAVIYTVLNTVSVLWTLGLILFGMITVHEYSLKKGIITAVLTVVGICIIIFMLLLIISIGQNVFDYFFNLYKEISLRIYS